MRKHELLRSGDTIIRVLEVRQDKALIINCIKRTMPVWVEPDALESYSNCSIEALREATGIDTLDIKEMDADQRKVMYDRYTMIAPVLPFVADDKMRSTVIHAVVTEHGISKPTIRNHLCLYLAYMDITALAPKVKPVAAELTQDEKNMRWALNKFFYIRYPFFIGLGCIIIAFQDVFCCPFRRRLPVLSWLLTNDRMNINGFHDPMNPVFAKMSSIETVEPQRHPAITKNVVVLLVILPNQFRQQVILFFGINFLWRL